VLGLHRVTGTLWERLRGRKALQKFHQMREFYAQLLPKQALVFDIGANVGAMTQVFASLGARVVAVEPNADCVRHIELSTEGRNVEILRAAVGRAAGLGVLKVSDRKDKMSTLSDEWREAVTKENSDYTGMWQREETVPVVTLDALVERFGPPDYI